MNEYIKRDKVIDVYGDWYVEEGTEEGFIGTVKQLLEGFPSADVQPVVRCKDCIYSEMTTDGYCKYCQYLANEFDVIDAVYFDGNDFCSHGKRKGAGNEVN